MQYEDSLVIKSAWYYYMENLTQQAIAEKLGITRMKVVKLLERARQDGVIQFKIRQDGAVQMNLEKQLIQKWKLQDAFIVPNTTGDINDNIAQAAAMYINERLAENRFINMGYGDTTNKILNHLSASATEPLSVISLTGGVNIYLPARPSGRFNASLYLIPAPLRVSSSDVRNSLLKEPPVREILQMIHGATLTVIGIGGLNGNATLLSHNILTKNDFLYLSMNGAAGDILSHFIDKDGRPIDYHLDQCFLSISLEELRSLNNVIAAAAGQEKTEAIKAALAGNYIDVLITDEYTAARLIEDSN